MRPWLLFAALGAFYLGVLPARGADRPVKGVIIQFNGKKVDGVEASTKEKKFKPVFEKELAKLAAKLPGKPDVKVTHWYTVINGGAVHWTKGPADTGAKVMAALKKLPYVKSVEPDAEVGIGPPGVGK